MNKAIDESNIKGPKVVAPSKRNPAIDAKSILLDHITEQSWTQNNENPFDIIFVNNIFFFLTIKKNVIFFCRN